MQSDAFLAGQRAFRSSPDRMRNPYRSGTSEYNDFERGWTQSLKRSSDYVAKPGQPIFPTFSTSRPPANDIDEDAHRKAAAVAYAKASGG